jgi:intein-encoded DNA endonuclease-like protein
MVYYGGLPREKVLEVYNYVMQQRKQHNYGQRRLFGLIKDKFKIKINESTISGWIFRGIVPFANEKTQFKAKPLPKREELRELYINQKQSAEKLGKRYGVSTATVISWLRKYNILMRNHVQSMNTSLIKEELRQKRLRQPTKEYDFLGPDKAYILGVLCGDACLMDRFVRLEIRHDEDFIAKFTRCFDEVYGLKYKYGYYVPKKTFVAQINSTLIAQDLARYGNFRTRNWEVPEEIMAGNNEKCVGMFLRGFYDSEGSSSSRSSITCSSVNERGLKQVKELLRMLGIESTLRPQQKGRYFVLYIFRKERFKLFREKVGFTIKRKLDKLDETLNTGFFTKRSVADAKDSWRQDGKHKLY